MYTPHVLFESPADPNVKIWRYLDFTKYVSLLDQGALYFTRADRFEDRFEGSLTAGTVAAIQRRLAHLSPDDQKEARAIYAEQFRNGVREMAISSWHMNEYESAAMWKLYLKSNEGVAIQSSYARLADSFAPSPEDVMIGVVKYVDYRSASFALDNAFWPFLHKRKSFEHENELRAIVWKPQEFRGRELGWKPVIENGLGVKVVLETLIENVYVSPTSPSWFRDLVGSASARYGLRREPVRSDLESDPIF